VKTGLNPNLPPSIMTQNFERKGKVMKLKNDMMKLLGFRVPVIYNCVYISKKIVIEEDGPLGNLKI
jgi:hypothetical protein